MLVQFDHQPHDPLFQIQTKSGFTPLTDSVGRKHLKQISLVLNTSKSLTCHDFRRAGANLSLKCSNSGYPGTGYLVICVWRYIHLLPSMSSRVSSTFICMMLPFLLLLGTWGFLHLPSIYMAVTHILILLFPMPTVLIFFHC